MRAYYGNEIASVYKEVLSDLLLKPDFTTSPRGMEVKEIRDCSIEIANPMVNIYSNKYTTNN